MRINFQAEGSGPSFAITAMIAALTGAGAATFLFFKGQEKAAADFAEYLCYEAVETDDE